MSQNAEQVVSVVLCAKVGAYVKNFPADIRHPYIRAGDFLMGGGM